jgi:hypothetical protein
MKRREFLKWAGVSAVGALLPTSCESGGVAGPDAGPAGRDAGTSGPDAASAPDGSARVDAGLGAKLLHYFTDFAEPELAIHGGTTVPMSSEGTGVVRASFGDAGHEALFFPRDAASGHEDHPPGGGEYRMPADLDEAWLFKGAIFDVDPRRLSIDLIDAHTHPFNRAADGSIVPDSGPLLEVEQAQGVAMALTMVNGTFADQLALVGGMCQSRAWLVPLVWIEPQRDAVADVEAMLRDHGCKGLKFHPTLSAYDADGPLMDQFLELARRYRVPVQLHSATDDHATPERIAALARRFPDVSVVMVHTELGAIDKHHALSTIVDLPNVFAETSWTNPDGVLLAMQLLDSSRTLFGTDATVDGREHYTKQSIADPSGQYTLTLPEVISQVRARADPDAFANWARLTVTRLYGLRFKPIA